MHIPTINDESDKIEMQNICDKCNTTLHPNFIGHHRCGYANCPVCKTAITNSDYWNHIRTHPGHENDSPPPPRNAASFDKRRARDNRHHYNTH